MAINITCTRLGSRSPGHTSSAALEPGLLWLESKSGLGWLDSESGLGWLESESGLGWLESESTGRMGRLLAGPARTVTGLIPRRGT